ncbi:STAS domain-containing protein [Streptomyces sp. NPDC048448]|uniref:STAS domain-containing protein n=1 Tax=Streptomyces sp. NPDC048448 TaxID=3365554 RepID=UPI0037188A6B
MHDTAGQRARLTLNEATAAGIRVPALSGEVDADNVHLLRQALRVDGSSASRTVPDLSGLAFMDSSVIGVLAAA